MSLKDLDMPLSIPGLPPIPTADVPLSLKDRQSKRYEIFLNIATAMRKSDGIIVNTFESLETKAITAIKSGLCVPEEPTPPVFCIGPLISNDQHGDKDEYMSWLNSQPSQSVMFLSFGSLGRFSVNQLKEMAIGLERSEQRFMWVVRKPPSSSECGEFSLNELLPKGFMERTKDRGLVVRDWAPQVKILSHDSVGGFVTHCGWNSILEAICGGVPMITWPLYAEQRVNRVMLVEEMKVGLALKESEDGLVSGDELEKRVREVMEWERGKEMRETMLSIRKSAVAARREGGSSLVALNGLAELWKQN